MKSFEKYFNKPLAPMPEYHVTILERGEEIPFANALPRNQINKLFEPGYLKGESGYCRMENGSMYTSVLTKMPGVTIPMIDWWFWWHAAEGIRYQIWYPGMHFDISSDFGGHYNDEALRYGERLHRSTHLVTEDVGMGSEKILIDFMDPIDFGFDKDQLNPEKYTIICGKVGSPSKGLRFVDMCHFVRRTDDGVEMRSRFWMGHHIEKMSGFGKSLVSVILNKPFIKRNLIPSTAGRNMFHHCSQEFHHLASLLPELHKEEG